MRHIFENEAAFDPMGEVVAWRQDKAPHFEGSFKACVIHGDSAQDLAGHSRGGIPADPWTVIVGNKPAECVGMVAGDTITLKSGTVLMVQQITKDDALGWVIKCTANARAPK